MSDKELLELVKAYLNDDYITKATFDFENTVTLDRIRIECTLVNNEND